MDYCIANNEDECESGCNDIDNCHGDCDKVHCGGGMNNCVDGIDVGGVAPEYCRLYPSCRARAAYLLVALGGQRRYTVSECRRYIPLRGDF